MVPSGQTSGESFIRPDRWRVSSGQVQRVSLGQTDGERFHKDRHVERAPSGQTGGDRFNRTERWREVPLGQTGGEMCHQDI